MKNRFILLALLALALGADAADPWIGKTEADVVALLGEPAQSKPESDGGRTLSYKLVRLDEGMPAPGVMPVALPGVGLVGIVPREQGSPAPGTAQLGPMEFDEQGRATAGGVTESSSVNTTWDTSTGKKTTTTTGELGRPGSRGKLTLKFRLAPDGTIREWKSSDTKKKGKE